MLKYDSKCAPSGGEPSLPHLMHGSLDRTNPHLIRHLDRFSRFSTAHDRNQQTRRHTISSGAAAGPSSQYTDIAKFAGHLPHRYGNSRAIWDHTVLPLTRQR